MLNKTLNRKKTNSDLSWFNKCLERGKTEIFAEVATITPSLAQHILESNYINRPVKLRHLSEISHDIAENRWEINGETVIISKTGKLNDGQHRLISCVDTMTSIQTLIAFGVSDASKFTVDMGKSRSAPDFMGMQGVKNVNNTATVCRLYDCYVKESFNRRGNWQTRTYLLDFYNAHAEEIDNAVLKSQAIIIRGFGVPSYALAYLVLKKINPSACEQFFESLRDGAGLSRTSPILIARNHLLHSKDSSNLQGHHRAALIFMYWNAWRNNRSLSRAIHVPKSWPELAK